MTYMIISRLSKKTAYWQKKIIIFEFRKDYTLNFNNGNNKDNKYFSGPYF